VDGFYPGGGGCVIVEHLPMNEVNQPPIFEVRQLSYTYAGNIPALTQVNFSIRSGEMVALVGANGSGKSTLLKLLDGLVFPTQGEILVFGQTLSEKALQDRAFVKTFRQRVGMVFQDPDVQLFSATVWDEVTFGPLQLKIPPQEVEARANRALELLNLSQLKERPPYLLSGGEKKKVSLASVLSMQPQVLLLDEPTNGLDPYSQGKLIDFLLTWAAAGNSLVFSTQDLDMVEEIASRVIVLGKEHQIEADGPPPDYLFDPDFLLKTNLIHEHSHRHKTLVHRHPHAHEHQHPDSEG
jgi:cobalt/nickel transport system ATP-binding protein